ncbi:MAG: nitroreductase family protein, partial [Candidatus Bathyarchaeota archaeon]|nr:nitroreductase family protein [Candidatus Bathyarchaeota archaeon]
MNLDVGKEFMEKTKYRYLGESDQSKGLPQPPLELPYDESKKVHDLPAPATLGLGDYPLGKAITERRSLRAYSDEPLTLEELSWLLWCTQGVKEMIGRPATLRTVPSAGARHAFET